MTTTSEKIAIMQAYERGEKIEARDSSGTGWTQQWHKADDPCWDWWKNEYRIKPREPKVIWINEYVYEGKRVFVPHESETEARQLAYPTAIRTAVKYVEEILQPPSGGDE